MKIKLCDEFFYRVTNLDENIYREFNTEKQNVLRNNEKINLYKGEIIKVKVNDFKTHYVKPAETIKEIADFYSVDVEKLMIDNNLENSKLYIGQRLKVYN